MKIRSVVETMVGVLLAMVLLAASFEAPRGHRTGRSVGEEERLGSERCEEQLRGVFSASACTLPPRMPAELVFSPVYEVAPPGIYCRDGVRHPLGWQLPLRV